MILFPASRSCKPDPPALKRVPEGPIPQVLRVPAELC
jgi:hypothetical protein